MADQRRYVPKLDTLDREVGNGPDERFQGVGCDGLSPGNENAPRIAWMEGRFRFRLMANYFFGFTADQIWRLDI
jgi:hypothetical protein